MKSSAIASYVRQSVAVSLLAICSCGAGAAPVWAQSESASSRHQQTMHFDIEKGDLGRALSALGHQAKVQIAFLPDRVAGRRVPRLRGKFTVEQALARLLSGTGLRYEKLSERSFVVGGPTKETFSEATAIARDYAASQGFAADGKIEVPEILVQGRRWTLNTDIPRTEDDAQPYVVFQHEEIARSGSASLEDFFRNRLGANVSGPLSTSAPLNEGQSRINLRGLGANATLILVDGRPFAQFNDRAGDFTQASINGIPLDAIERIEVLASSASGIYGANAVGGVINIIMRRDYQGFEANIYYGNTSRLEAGERRLSLSGGVPLEGGRTRISFTGSYAETSSLFLGDRNFVARGRAFASANDSNFVDSLGLIDADFPNIASVNGTELRFKPQYGGQSLGSAYLAVPQGYRGLALDGVLPLLGGVGTANLGQAPGTVGSGRLATIIAPTKTYSGQLSVRREFSEWLNFYSEISYRRYENSGLLDRAPPTFDVAASAPNNPFTTDIRVAVPQLSGRAHVSSRDEVLGAVAGFIIDLPLDWKAFADASWSRNTHAATRSPPGIDLSTVTDIQNGAIDILRDPYDFPLDLDEGDASFGSFSAPSRSTAKSFSLKLAGPVPLIKFWGRRPIATFLLQQSDRALAENISYINVAGSPDDASSVFYNPPRSYRTRSAYGEVRLPIIGEDNHVPLVEAFELQIAGRFDGYRGRSPTVEGTDIGTSIECLRKNGPLTAEEIANSCPPSDLNIVYNSTARTSFTPTFAAKWTILPDISIRGSYSRGFQPPLLTQLARTDGPSALERLGPLAASFPGYSHLLGGSLLVTNVTDPLRGNEAVGTGVSPLPGIIPPLLNLVKGIQGGNPDVLPQRSQSYSAGLIFTPAFAPGLRISVDWTKIVQRDLYFAPFALLSSGNTPEGQEAFEAYLAAHPERFQRGAIRAGDPYNVGPIEFIDATTANMFRGRSETIDFSGSYDAALGEARLSFDASGTLLLKLDRQLAPAAQPIDYTGVADSSFELFVGGLGGVKFKGNGSLNYATDRWSLGTRATYFSGYWLNSGHSVVTAQGSARVSSQVYFDLFGSAKLFDGTEVRVGVNNVFDRKPPIVARGERYYSSFGDPRLRNFYVNIKQSF